MSRGAPILLAAMLLAACDRGHAQDAAREPDGFPLPARPVAAIVSARWSTETARDHVNEARAVMDRGGIAPGMTVADIGAGEGYYTVRLAKRVGDKGRVLAEDIVPATRDRLAERVAREGLDNVSVRLGQPADPRLPAGSFDRVLMVHMYHEIGEPLAFLWNLRPALKPDGLVVVVDADRPTDRHGTPPALLDCEFGAVGYRRVSSSTVPSAGGYLAEFRAAGARPAPGTIHACDAAGRSL